MKWDEVGWMDKRIDTWGGMDEVGWSWVNGWENIYLRWYGWSGMKLDEWTN